MAHTRSNNAIAVRMQPCLIANQAIAHKLSFLIVLLAPHPSGCHILPAPAALLCNNPRPALAAASIRANVPVAVTILAMVLEAAMAVSGTMCRGRASTGCNIAATVGDPLWS